MVVNITVAAIDVLTSILKSMMNIQVLRSACELVENSAVGL